MADRLLTLDKLCAAVEEAFRGTNASLSTVPLPNEHAPAPSLQYPIRRETKYQLRSIPYSAFQSLHRYRLCELSFSLTCCVVVHRVGRSEETALRLCAPAWWRTLGKPLVCKRIDISVRAEGTTVGLRPGDRAQLPRNGRTWVLLLTREQQIALTGQACSAHENARHKTKKSIFDRVAVAFFNLFGIDRKHHKSVDKDS